MEDNHIPSSIIKFPELIINGYFKNLKHSNFLDPYLREFLFKLYHCRLYFKKYKLNINDYLNNGHRCILCRQFFDTPTHLFLHCNLGSELRTTRNFLINELNILNIHYGPDKLAYSNFKFPSNAKAVQFIITSSNYTIYKFKMKKFFNVDANINETSILHAFIQKVKSRIATDLKRMNSDLFNEIWDPGGRNSLFHISNGVIDSWSF